MGPFHRHSPPEGPHDLKIIITYNFRGPLYTFGPCKLVPFVPLSYTPACTYLHRYYRTQRWKTSINCQSFSDWLILIAVLLNNGKDFTFERGHFESLSSVNLDNLDTSVLIHWTEILWLITNVCFLYLMTLIFFHLCVLVEQVFLNYLKVVSCAEYYHVKCFEICNLFSSHACRLCSVSFEVSVK